MTPSSKCYPKYSWSVRFSRQGLHDILSKWNSFVCATCSFMQKNLVMLCKLNNFHEYWCPFLNAVNARWVHVCLVIKHVFLNETLKALQNVWCCCCERAFALPRGREWVSSTSLPMPKYKQAEQEKETLVGREIFAKEKNSQELSKR